MRSSRTVMAAAGTLLAVTAAASVPALAQEDTVLVQVDRAKVLKLDRPAQTVILGNPAIADALVQERTMLVITGKSFGATNLIALDRDGQTIQEYVLQVQTADDGMVTVQKGANRLSFSCAPVCERTLAVGDTPESYDQLNTQIQSRIGLAIGAQAEN